MDLRGTVTAHILNIQAGDAIRFFTATQNASAEDRSFTLATKSHSKHESQTAYRMVVESLNRSIILATVTRGVGSQEL
jgi:hypothetical protein